MGILKRVTVVAAIVVPLVSASGALSAGANAEASDAAVVAGQGTISPGLLVGCPVTGQHVTFDGTAAITGDETQVGPLHFEGDSTTCETLLSGSGAGVLSGVMAGPVSYTRNGNVVVVTGSPTVGTEIHTITAVCQFHPTSANPTTSYELTCQAELAS